MEDKDVALFQKKVWEYYRAFGRHDLPWRQPDPDGTFSAYKIAVSEVMLQQTQVPRVIPKFEAFIRQFPRVSSLAVAPLSEVLKAWSGLGYNRRAKFLWQAAGMVMEESGGTFPQAKEALIRLPGIGPNTAGAILVYALNQPEVFIETNIRSVFIHHFFNGQEKVTDKDIYRLVERSLPSNDFRAWYWALMDYGTFLKQTVGNAAQRSSAYAKQSRFEGSKRQVRGRVLRLLGEGARPTGELAAHIPDERLIVVLEDLAREGFIEQVGGLVKLCDV